ncbi:hypothetical protein ACEWY4_022139 [Coilia grayii]|uniref:C-C motif chemokine n=1 Tax=Coilia grayii TaxID=363190 RepID=A0ABD1J6P4_9TELE
MKLCCAVAVALLVLARPSQGQRQLAYGPNACCFTYYSKAISDNKIKAYQETHPLCTLKAVMLITVKDEKICANQKVKQVQDIMDKVDTLWSNQTTVSSLVDHFKQEECCFSYNSKLIPPKSTKAYKITHPSCPQKGVVLFNMENVKICANPEVKQVQDLMDYVDKKWGNQTTVKSVDATGLDECCVSYYNEPVPANDIKAYKMTHPSCLIEGVILITKMDKNLCANPHFKQVQDIMDYVDNGVDAETAPPAGQSQCCFEYQNDAITSDQIQSYRRTSSECPNEGIM